MNGLEETYQAQIQFQSINATSTDGKKIFRFYALPGHPGFVLLNPQGEVLWKASGEQSQEHIESNLEAALANWSTSP